MKESLIIHVIGKENAINMSALTGEILDHHCYPIKCRYTTFGDHWSFMAQADGQWNNLTKLESSLENKAKTHGISVHCQRCNDTVNQEPLLPYTIELISPAKEELLHEICKFLDTRQVMITEIYSQTNNRNYTQTMITTIVIKIYIPADTHLTDLREQFMLLCDDLNIDAILEPEKR